jgi:hypothetical protein
MADLAGNNDEMHLGFEPQVEQLIVSPPKVETTISFGGGKGKGKYKIDIEVPTPAPSCGRKRGRPRKN